MFTKVPYQLGGRIGEVIITCLYPMSDFYYPFGLKKHTHNWHTVNVHTLMKKLKEK